MTPSDLAAEKAGLKEYDVRVVPRPKSFVELLMADLAGDDKDEGQIQTAAAAVAGWRPESLWQAVAPLLGKLQPQQAAGRAARPAAAGCLAA